MAGTLAIVLLVTGVLLMLVAHAVVVLWVLRHVFGERADDGPRGTTGLSADELGKLPCHEFTAGGSGDCAVCLEGFQAGDRCRVLPQCEHSFHALCVDSWLHKSRVCPICRAEVIGHGKAAAAVAEAAVEIVAER